MGIISTSRTRLLSRTVCVQRRLIRDDGTYGTYQDYQTVVPRYWVHIYPAQHQERRTREVGEAALDSTHRAIGQPYVNGRHIMIGDRFYDIKNNETYDIVGVDRFYHRSPNSSMHQFTLRIVKDDGVQYGQCTLDSNG